ncbi:hypothetical protein, partial [Allofournierella massiliensis]|uniref:hypothetical protein n=1 Tax=Allofournierella massiliensis TaxID=1650663 RepID=UPI00155F1381
ACAAVFLFCSLSPPTKVANFPQFPVDFLFADFVFKNAPTMTNCGADQCAQIFTLLFVWVHYSMPLGKKQTTRGSSTLSVWPGLAAANPLLRIQKGPGSSD